MRTLPRTIPSSAASSGSVSPETSGSTRIVSFPSRSAYAVIVGGRPFRVTVNRQSPEASSWSGDMTPSSRLRSRRELRPRQMHDGNIDRVKVLQIDTPHGSARAHLRTAKEPRAALILGHGAGGGVDAPDLTAAAQAAGTERISVAPLEHPYRVAGRRSPPP